MNEENPTPPSPRTIFNPSIDELEEQLRWAKQLVRDTYSWLAVAKRIKRRQDEKGRPLPGMEEIDAIEVETPADEPPQETTPGFAESIFAEHAAAELQPVKDGIGTRVKRPRPMA